MTPKGIAIFDVDMTLCRAFLPRRFGKYLYRHARFSFLRLAQVFFLSLCERARCTTKKTLHTKGHHWLRTHLSLSLLQQDAQTFWDTERNSLIRTCIWNELVALQDAGYFVALASASPDFLIAPIAKELKIPFLASQYTQPSGDDWAPHVSSVGGEEKKRYLVQLCQQLGTQSTLAYSDSFEDRILLEAASKAIFLARSRWSAFRARRCGWITRPI